MFIMWNQVDEWKISCCNLALSEYQMRKLAVFVWQTTSKQLHQKACGTCSKIIFPHSTNQICGLTLPSRSSLGSLRNEEEKNLHVPHAFGAIFFDDDGKFSFLRFWRELAAGNLSFIYLLSPDKHSCQASESAPHLFCTTWPTWLSRIEISSRLNLTEKLLCKEDHTTVKRKRCCLFSWRAKELLEKS